MQILVSPSDLIKRCLWLEYKRFFLKEKKEDEIKNFVLDDKPLMLKEDDAFVIGLLKVVETPNLVHRFKDHTEEFLTNRSIINNNRLFIRINDMLRYVSEYKECFPDYFLPSFEYKKGIDDFLGEQRHDFYCIWIKQDNIISQLQKIGTFFGNKPIIPTV